jgi:hypothetical protein
VCVWVTIRVSKMEIRSSPSLSTTTTFTTSITHLSTHTHTTTTTTTTMLFTTHHPAIHRFSTDIG